MAASSVTGTGYGSAHKPTISDIQSRISPPVLLFAGYLTSTGTFTSPPSSGSFVYFPYPLPGGPDKYVVLLTGLNTGACYVFNRRVDEDGNFIGFDVTSEVEGEVMYMVAQVGARPAP